MDYAEIARLTAHGLGLAEIRQVVVADGPGAGGRLLEVRLPSGLRADIALDRGGDLLRLSLMGREFGWHSGVQAPAPAPDFGAEHGLGFLRGFDGFLVTCGLDHHGVPAETSAAEARYPLRRVHVHPLHGRIAAQKAELLGQRIDWRTGEAVIDLRLRQVSVFGESLELERTYIFALTEPRLRIADRVTNTGFRPARHGILYHFNLGYPLLGPGGRLAGEAWALRDRLDADPPAPSEDHVEVVAADASPADGRIGYRRPGFGRIDIAFDPACLPVTALWKAYRAGIFALGLEPQTDLADPEAATLAPGAVRHYDITLSMGSQ